MNEFLKLYHQLMAKGSATSDEFARLKELAEAEDAPEGADDKVAEVEEITEGEDQVIDKETEKALKTVISGAVEEAEAKAEARIEKAVQKALNDHKELNEKRAGVYSTTAKKERNEVNKRLRKFFGALAKNDYTTLEKMQSENSFYKKELTTDDTGSPYGGYVVDEELNAEIMHLLTEYGVARREFTTHTLSRGSYKVNELVTDVTVQWADSETSALQSTQFVLGQNTLELKRLYAIVTLTNTLVEDSEIDLMSFIAGRVAEGMAQAEDEAFFNGDGTASYGSFTGLLNVSGTNEVVMTSTSIANVDDEDFIDMADETPQGAHANGKFYMNRTIMSYVRKLKDANGMPIYQRPSETGPATIYGYPVVLVEAMPSKAADAPDTSFVLFGDLKKGAIFGQKGGLRVEMFNAGTVRNVADSGDINLITSDRRAVRFIERVGYVSVLENAVTKLTTGSASA